MSDATCNPAQQPAFDEEAIARKQMIVDACIICPRCRTKEPEMRQGCYLHLNGAWVDNIGHVNVECKAHNIRVAFDRAHADTAQLRLTEAAVRQEQTEKCCQAVCAYCKLCGPPDLTTTRSMSTIRGRA